MNNADFSALIGSEEFEPPTPRRQQQGKKKAKPKRVWKKPTQKKKKKPEERKPSQSYRDRAKERRSGTNPDFEEPSVELAQIAGEYNKFLGGTESTTHLVHGLDYQLLARVRSDMDDQGPVIQQQPVIVEKKKAAPKPKKTGPSFQSMLARRIHAVAFGPANQALVVPPRLLAILDAATEAAAATAAATATAGETKGDDSKLDQPPRSGPSAKDIVSLASAAASAARVGGGTVRSSTFLEGHMAYEFELEGADGSLWTPGGGGDAGALPTTIMRSRDDLINAGYELPERGAGSGGGVAASGAASVIAAAVGKGGDSSVGGGRLMYGPPESLMHSLRRISLERVPGRKGRRRKRKNKGDGSPRSAAATAPAWKDDPYAYLALGLQSPTQRGGGGTSTPIKASNGTTSMGPPAPRGFRGNETAHGEAQQPTQQPKSSPVAMEEDDIFPDAGEYVFHAEAERRAEEEEARKVLQKQAVARAAAACVESNPPLPPQPPPPDSPPPPPPPIGEGEGLGPMQGPSRPPQGASAYEDLGPMQGPSRPPQGAASAYEDLGPMQGPSRPPQGAASAYEDLGPMQGPSRPPQGAASAYEDLGPMQGPSRPPQGAPTNLGPLQGPSRPPQGGSSAMPPPMLGAVQGTCLPPAAPHGMTPEQMAAAIWYQQQAAIQQQLDQQRRAGASAASGGGSSQPVDMSAEAKKAGMATVFKKGDASTYGRRKGTKGKVGGAFEGDGYSECFPDAAQLGHGCEAYDSDEDLSQMDGSAGKKRSEFDSEADWERYRSRKVAMPKAAFQFGLKMADGRRTRTKTGRGRSGGDEQRKLDAQLRKINKINEGKKPAKRARR